MLRNREFFRMLLLFSLITAALAGTAFWLDPTAGCFVLSGMLLSCGVFLWYTIRRYRELQRLSGYLFTIRNGERSMDIRDNREGELSILKNDIYKLTVTLEEQSDLLKKDKKYLADALADISHQLKTPLTSIRVMTDLLAGGALDEEKRREFTGNVSGQLNRIEWLVASLLKLSRIDAGAVGFRRERFRVSDAARRSAAPLLIPAELRDQELLLEGDESVCVTGDLSWTVEALVNLLKNCVEHTGCGGTIRISWAENPLHVEIIVQDTGGGIAPEDLPHVFDRFYRGKNASPDSVGIGLAMAKAVLLNQNADISVQSGLGEGTRFTIRFYKAVI